LFKSVSLRYAHPAGANENAGTGVGIGLGVGDGVGVGTGVDVGAGVGVGVGNGVAVGVNVGVGMLVGVGLGSAVGVGLAAVQAAAAAMDRHATIINLPNCTVRSVGPHQPVSGGRWPKGDCSATPAAARLWSLDLLASVSVASN
jgi:hypothetical protein